MKKNERNDAVIKILKSLDPEGRITFSRQGFPWLHYQDFHISHFRGRFIIRDKMAPGAASLIRRNWTKKEIILHIKSYKLCNTAKRSAKVDANA